jgi:hypothetical protein
MSDESEVVDSTGPTPSDSLPAEPTGADLARDFESQTKTEDDNAPAVIPGEEPAAPKADELPTVDDSQEIPPAYAEQLRQMQEVQQEREAMFQQYIQRQNAELEQLRRAQQSAPPPEAQKFNVDEWKKLVETDPVKAIQQAALMGVNPKLQSLEQKLAQAEQFKQEQMFDQRMNSFQNDCQRKYPDFKPGSPLYQAAYTYVQKNAEWLKETAIKYPNFNPVEAAIRHVSYDFLLQKNKAQDSKLVDKRKRSATVVPSTTAPVVPAGVSSARAAAAELAAKGEGVPEKWVQAMERAAKKHDLA